METLKIGWWHGWITTEETLSQRRVIFQILEIIPHIKVDYNSHLLLSSLASTIQ